MTMSSTAAPVPYRARTRCAMLIALALPMLSGAASLSGAAGEPPPGAAATTLSRLPPSWRDDRGETLQLQALRGAPIFVTMAYTSCHRICPMTIARLEELQSDLDARGLSAEFLVVSYDPDNDGSNAWRQYRTRHHLLRDNWHFLSGTAADTERLARVLGFEFWRDGEHIMHDYRIVALDRDGAQRGIIDSIHRDWRNLP
jgi:protein SCO1